MDKPPFEQISELKILVHLLLKLFPLRLFVLLLHCRLPAGGIAVPSATAAGALLVVVVAVAVGSVGALAAAPFVLQREVRADNFSAGWR